MKLHIFIDDDKKLSKVSNRKKSAKPTGTKTRKTKTSDKQRAAQRAYWANVKKRTNKVQEAKTSEKKD